MLSNVSALQDLVRCMRRQPWILKEAAPFWNKKQYHFMIHIILKLKYELITVGIYHMISQEFHTQFSVLIL